MPRVYCPMCNLPVNARQEGNNFIVGEHEAGCQVQCDGVDSTVDASSLVTEEPDSESQAA